MSTSASTPRALLGIALTPESIEAVLLSKTDDALRTVHRMVRTRSQFGESGSDYSTVLPGLRSNDDSDFTLEVGDRGGSDLDLHFDDDLKDLSSESGKVQGPRPFDAQLREILAECADKGYPSPELAFCIGAPDVSYVEITLPALSSPEKGEDEGWMASVTDAVGRMGSPWNSEEKLLHTKLRAAVDGPYDAERVIFLPMDESERERRFLAVVPMPAESVTPTVRRLLDQDGPDPLGRLMEAEASLYADYVVRNLSPAEDETSVVVRVGSDDSLLLFLQGSALIHAERLPSLTTFDPPDMISSRVLLHLDDQKVGDADHLLLASGPRDDRLTESLRRTFTTAAVHRLDERLQDDAPTASKADVQLIPQSGPAMLAALRLLSIEDGAFDNANLLSSKLRQKRSRVSFAWHTVLMLAILFIVAAGFGWRYMDQQQTIRSTETMLATSPQALPSLSAEDLKHKVDSLDAVHQRYTRALYVLDSLLLGSDEWSRAIEKTAGLTGSVRGIWFETWSIDASSIEVRGQALSRGNLARLARDLDAVVEEIGFSEIGNRRVYPFAIRFPRSTEMPEVALALREQALTPDATFAANGSTAAPTRTVSSETP